MSFLKKFINKIIKKFTKKQKNNWNQDNNWSTWNQDSWSTCSINSKEEFESPLVSIEEENQLEIEIFQQLYEIDYKVFISYEEFKEHLVENKIINYSLKNYTNVKNCQLQGILSFLEAHICSYFYIFEEGYKYSKMNNTNDLNLWRAEGYQQDFEYWFSIVNEECKKYNIKLL
ncbi:hypothetical protein F8M41_020793 [Gigaspora margarita]|uniref:Uncharacterized protein n=1 Tax=Gigaspora margarita TaxID=4874 RepID=A0A8H4EJF0_GIGMA|nr:hypothetical protein F8M41_020793 [Gigaspora margarita]